MSEIEKDIDKLLENFKPEVVNSLYNFIDDLDDPRSVCVKLLKHHKGNIEVSKFLYYVIVNYDLDFPDFYKITLENITVDTLPSNTVFLIEIIDSDVSITLIQEFISHIVNLILEIDTTSLINILDILNEAFYQLEKK
ncbi:uncharacterized protein VNE69_10094 [Vairimorpha necatrix]|uniref:Uncharacterized protein n=1 Tax=Vairimorpha necatrix TaxID=6039 RepID=A0AAX4JFI5_9MICR